MQAKKRAKPVKFGRKLEKPKSAANLPRRQAGDEKPTSQPAGKVANQTASRQDSQPEKAEKEEKNENSVEIIVETQSEDVQVTVPSSENQNPEQKDEPSGTSLTSEPSQNHSVRDRDVPTGTVPPVSKEEENKTEPSKEQDQLIPITQNSDTVADTPSEPESTTSAPLSGDTYIVEKEVKKNMLGYFWLIAIISFVVGLLSMAALNFFLPNAGMSAGIFFFSRPITATPSPKPTSKPTPIAKVLNLAEYSIEILNGSGITGEATKLKESLVNEGFKVDTVGNADSSDYNDTIIFAKEEVSSEYLTKLKEKLKETYTLDADIKAPTGATSEADIIITIGSNTAIN